MEIDAVTLGLFLASAVRLSGPLILASLGELISERAGVFNIGLEGIMLIGAFAGAATMVLTGSPMLGVAAGVGGGVASAAILATAVVIMRADQVVTGIGFNLLALGTTSLLRQLLLAGPTESVSVRAVSVYKIPVLSTWPIVGRGLFSQSPLLYGGVVAGLLLWLMFRYTRLGLLVRAAGEGATAADAAGLSVTAIRFGAMLATGAMTGLGGAYLAIVASGGVFVDDITAGRGYLSIAIAIFGRWNPIWVVLTSILFGCADALQYQGQSIGLNISPALLLMFPFVLALVAWVAIGRSATGPSDLGRPFIRSAR
ncbi:ABC transporter permease [Beijerinckia sp. L45]|uniref:ABC transporter permease n=1 Tax=Beijerinckia sp. L45 TaxID=1641855 RepID=UPI00131DCB1D|nr:ABC transporter permease [Beijerinckia sp. L45]